MPRVTYVKSARKDNAVANKGEPYYWWKFRFGGKRFSKTYPHRAQLTQSAYYGTIYHMQDDDYGEINSEDDLQRVIGDLTGQIEELQSECQGSLENMPESLQSSPTGELIQERIDACESAMGDLMTVEWDETVFEEADEQYDHSDIEAALSQLDV